MKKLYLIRLTPVDTYFFGNENTFNEGTSQNYYVKSNRLPQVSTLLGALRYEILRLNGLDSYAYDQSTLDRVKELIGNKGFCMNSEVENYGIIHSISPLFVENKKEGLLFTPMPLDNGIEIASSKKFKCSLSTSQTVDCIIAQNYDYKNFHNAEYWISNEKNKESEENIQINQDEIFFQKEQVGITKNNKFEDESDAYYKVVNYGLKPDYNFVFAAVTSPLPLLKEDKTTPSKESSSFIYMGGNRSMFKMEIEEKREVSEEELKNDTFSASTYFTERFANLHKDGRHLLLGDAFLEDDERAKISFYWAESQNNRYIITAHDSKRHWGKPKKTSLLFHLLGRGGVIYAKTVPTPKYLTCVGLNIFV